MDALLAWGMGLWKLLRSPWLVVLPYLLLLAATLPLAAKVHRDLPSPVRPFVVEPGAGPVPDFEWLDEVTANKRGLLGALGPEVIGVAAPLDNIDRLLDARSPAFVLLLSAFMLVAWAWLWGGMISRFAGRRTSFLTACQRSFSDILALSVGGLIASLLVYGVGRLILFTPLALLPAATAESTLFVARLAATIFNVAAVVAVMLVFDYARILLVLDDVSIPAALRRGLQWARQHWMPAGTLVLLSWAALAGVLVAYALFEFIPGGSVPTVTRVILLGQLYITARIVLRLWNAAAQVALVGRIRSREASV